MIKSLLKTAREKKGLMTREVAQQLGIDQALVSKFESGTRKPTRKQVIKLAEILDLNTEILLIDWLKEKILYEIGDDELALKAIVAAEEQVKYKNNQPQNITTPRGLKTLLSQIDKLKKKLDKFREFDSYRIAQALELEYTFESNRIEGNTLTLKETDLVINEGLTISGKTMREHLEAVNHKEAIDYVKHLIDKKSDVNEREVLTLHNLILRGIDQANAGKYRSVQVMIKGSAHVPPAPYLVAKKMEEYFIWYQTNKTKIHPVILAAEMHEKLVTIHPFIDGNGRTSRLVMNLILLKHGYIIANIKGDATSRMAYYNALEKVQTNKSKNDFLLLVAQTEHDALLRYIDIIGK
jgi:Fic family protein/DNA-binding XRE family transcriptional regulator